jgi:subtilisin-like proprotein convertase family protein
MPRKIFTYFTLPLLLLLSNSSGNSASWSPEKSPEGETGTLEKMIVANGKVALDLDLNRLKGGESEAKETTLDTLRFHIGPNSFFTVLVFNDMFRGPEQGSIGLVAETAATLPGQLQASLNQLVIEKLPSEAPFDLAVRDGKTGFVYFNVEGNIYEYDAGARLLTIKDGRLLVSEEFATSLGRPAEAGTVAGRISIATTTYPIETTTLANGAVQSIVLPPLPLGGGQEFPNSAPGPDVIVGDLSSMQQFGSNVTQVGVAIGTTSCNNGTVGLNWSAMPNTDHPVIPQNLYRMSGGAANDERFEQIGQSWLKHAFAAVNGNACGFGCSSSGSGLRPGCSDPYGASLNASQSGLGSRAWVNPFTGIFPSTARDHTGHSDSSAEPTHRALVAMNDLNTTMNPGAVYFGEAQYVTPHEYSWCQSHPGECNMYNNVSYRQFTVSGTTSFTFVAAAPTVRTVPAINAWPGATINPIEPEPGVDGRAFVAYKVTNPSAGVWHYEYALYNQNLDRGIQSFSVPLGCGITLTNLGFHAPLNHPGIVNDGTQGSAGYGNAPWTSNQTASGVSWSTETFAQNQNANAIRWGTLYNFRFDSDKPPLATNATIGYFKNGAPSSVAILAPNACNAPTPTPGPTPPVTPTPTPTPSPSGTPCGAFVFSNPTTVNIPASGAASPYPSNIFVASGGIITKVTVKLNNLSHTFPSDIDVLLVGPGGQNVIIMSDVGGATEVGGITITLDDAAANNIIGPLTTGIFKPTNLVGGAPEPDTWPAPAPAPSGSSPLSAFVGTVSTGTWSLYVVDDTGSDLGSIGGWELTITTTNGSCVTPTPTPSTTPTVTPAPTATATPAPTATATPAPTATATPAPTATATPASTTTPTATPVPTAAPTATPTATPLATATPSPTAIPTATPSVSVTPTATPMATATATPAPSTTPTPGPSVTPTPTPPSALANIATRLRVESGDNVLIGGFIITGTAPKKVVIRAIGPSLGLVDQLANPTLELRNSSGALLDSNDDWQTSANREAIIDSGLAPTNDFESAIIATLPANANYTALARGLNNTMGIGVVEIYGLDGAANAKLANISSRGLVQTGNNVLFAGLIVVGQSSQNVVVRAIGPSLPIAGKLADPSLELRNGDGSMVEANDDWDLSNNKQALINSGLAPTNPVESAIIRALPPGNYTAIVKGAQGTTGIAVVEAYALD